MTTFKPRNGEVVGGGFFVFRRGKTTGRISRRVHVPPYEHGSREAAEAEATRLAVQYPGETFAVFQQITTRFVTPIKSSGGGK
jgi:hypothetical protein